MTKKFVAYRLLIDVMDYSSTLLITYLVNGLNKWFEQTIYKLLITYWLLIFHRVAQLLQLITIFQYFSLL